MAENLDGTMAPISPGERIGVIDILRGITLFGILAANMRGFNAPSQVYFDIDRMFSGTADTIAQVFVEGFVQGKCITLFSFLFGLGFAVQMSRAEERGKSVSFYPRRLAILLVIGLIHSVFIWWGDILVPYAVTGFFLLVFRKRSQQFVLWAAILLFASESLIPAATMLWHHFHPVLQVASRPHGLSPETTHAISVYRDGSFWGMTNYRIHDWARLNWPPMWLLTFVLPRFLAGLWVWRTGFLQNLEPRLPTVRKVALWSLVIGGTANLVLLYCNVIRPVPGGDNNLRGLLLNTVHEISSPAIACFYACAILLLVQHPGWKERLAPFAAIGRTALTNYLLQSIICTWFFHWTKMYGKVGPALDLIVTVTLFAFQIPVSLWWLKHYQFGPAEWLWRSFTYGRAQSMIRRIDTPAASALEPSGM